MDAELEKQMFKLNLINNIALSPSSSISQTAHTNTEIEYGKVGALINNTQDLNDARGAIGSDVKHGATLGVVGSSEVLPISSKKVGPLVPPKPCKKKHNLPEIPQTSIVRPACKPLYSQRLQDLDSISLNISPSTAINRPPILQRKQPIYATQNSLYDKNSKVTLDNPAILEQQLEALAHHKKQLEKKALLQQQRQKSKNQPEEQSSPVGNVSCIPKLSSTSLLNDLPRNNTQHNAHNVTYTNVCPPKTTSKNSNDIKEKFGIGDSCSNVYSNVFEPRNFSSINNSALIVAASNTDNIYSNIHYEEDDEVFDDLPSSTQPPALFIANVEEVTASTEYLNNTIDEIGQNVLSPPSPVSSSYSELQRVSDIYNKKTNIIIEQQNGCESNDQYPIYYDNNDGVDKFKRNTNRQTYMNMNYNNECTSYNPTSQGTNQDCTDYYSYESLSQVSSTYESIYEPINPRPPSELSTSRLNNYLPYTPYFIGNQQKEHSSENNEINSSVGDLVSLSAAINSGGSCLTDPNLITTNGQKLKSTKNVHYQNNEKETEVEVLTDFFVHSMDEANDVDNYGVCFKCHERVLGENSGCTAMEQIYHIVCFACSQCQINLQGKAFYALDSKPYCEYDYLQTLEKCSICMKPILERILRATGKPYHPQCFACVVCGKSLDGIPFTVDATNQNYCIADFHRKFAPRCCVCKEPIMPEPGEEETVRVVALDRSFHFECYKCEDCGLLLSSEAEGRGCYPLDDHVLCKSCNAKRVQMLTNRMITEL